jgi:hypothetical protein
MTRSLAESSDWDLVMGLLLRLAYYLVYPQNSGSM